MAHRMLSIIALVLSTLFLTFAAVDAPRFSRRPQSTPTALPPPAPGITRFAVIGDYGAGGQAEADVAALVKSWQPDFVITLGDNNYPRGEASSIDVNIGQFYSEFIAPYTGAYGPGGTTNRFFPALGNHDWISLGCSGDACTGPYFDYFVLPGNERFYDFIRGPIHFFAVDSDPHEPDGRSADSRQAQWLQAGLAASTAPWQIVYMHHTIYSSSLHGSEPVLQWPYPAWGADAVLTGHDHTYERVMRDGLAYIVNGMGGAGLRGFNAPVAGSAVRYNGDHGALLVEADAERITFQFINRSGEVIDRYVLDQADLPTPTPTPTPTSTPTPRPTEPASTPPLPLYLPKVER